MSAMTTSDAFAMTRRLPLLETGAAWLIESGSVDLFLVDLQGLEAHSSLEFVGSLAAGAVMLGMGGIALAGGLQTTLIAQPGPHTSLRALRIEDDGEGGNDLVTVEQLDDWITAIAGFCAPGQPPALSRQVEPGETITTTLEPVSLIGHREVTWLSGPGAHLAPFGELVSSARAMPVCRTLWVDVDANQTVTARGTADWFVAARQQRTANADLEALHHVLLGQRAMVRGLASKGERARFQEKMRRDGAVFGVALRQLVTPLVDLPVELTQTSDANDNGALACCRAVGNIMGLSIKAPLNAIPGEPARTAVVRVASSSNVRYRQVLLRERWYKQDQGPMIGFTLNGVSALAFLPDGGSNYVMFDPLTGERTRMTEELSASLDAFAYVLYRPFPSRKLTVFDLFTFGLRNSKHDLAVVLGVSAITGVLGMALPIATGVLFDTIIPEGQRNALVQMSVILLASSVAIFLMRLGQSFATQRMEGRMQSELEAALWDRLLNMRTGFFRNYTTGDLARRSLAVNHIREMLTGTVITSLLSGIFSVSSLVLLFYYSPSLALLALGLVSIAVMYGGFSTWVNLKRQRRTLALEGKVSGRVGEMLQGVAKFRVAGSEPTAFARWADAYSKEKKLEVLSSRVAMAMGIFDQVFPAATTILIYIVAAHMLETGPGFSIGRFLAFNAAFGQFLGSALGFSTAVLSLIGIIPIYERAKPILEEEPEQRPDLLDPGVLTGSIDVSHVTFRYTPDGPVVLNDLSLSIKAGQYVAFVGESGCGKSTMMRLLLGFETPENGSIFYEGRDFAELDKQAVRKQIGVVLQAGKLMPADVYTNIVGAAALSIDMAWEAAKRAGLDDDIRAMPMGMHTVISAAGGGLSGGQKQRIMIARALVNRPRILFFDEATSALDNQTQAVVSESLDAMQATRIVIAHRFSTIVHADQIFVFKEGSLHESGTYTELLEKDGYFAELAKRQIA